MTTIAAYAYILVAIGVYLGRRKDAHATVTGALAAAMFWPMLLLVSWGRWIA